MDNYQKPPLLVPVIFNYDKMTYRANGEELPKDKTNLMIYTLKPGEPLGKGESFKDSDIKDYKRPNNKTNFFVDMRTVRKLTEYEEEKALQQQHKRVMESVKNTKKSSSYKSLSKGGKKSRRRTNRKSNKKRRNKSKRL